MAVLGLVPDQTERHTPRLTDHWAGGAYYAMRCSCGRYLMVGSQKKGLRAAHAVHAAEKGQTPLWLSRLVARTDDGEPE